MSNRLQEKVVIVTGAAQGIGFGCARLLAAEGAAVVLGDIQKERGEQSAAIIRKEGGEALFCPADVREEQQCAALIEKAVQSYGKLNGLVNNAGWFPRSRRLLLNFGSRSCKLTCEAHSTVANMLCRECG